MRLRLRDTRPPVTFDAPRLLVVDEDIATCRACRRILSHLGFQVDVSRDAGLGLGRAMAEDYAAILLGMEMPGMDGLRFLEALRRTGRDVPVTVIAGDGSGAKAASAVRLGASDWIAKPFTPEQIIRSVLGMLALATGSIA